MQKLRKKIDDKASICVDCGVAVQNTPSKSRLTAGIFALLLGGIGVHKFYMGRVGLGFLYLLFCWTFIPVIIALIEGIVYLTESDKSFAKRLPE